MNNTNTFENSKKSMSMTLEDKGNSITPSFKNESVKNVNLSDIEINCSCKALGGDVTIFAKKPGGGQSKLKETFSDLREEQ